GGGGWSQAGSQRGRGSEGRASSSFRTCTPGCGYPSTGGSPEPGKNSDYEPYQSRRPPATAARATNQISDLRNFQLLLRGLTARRRIYPFWVISQCFST